MATATPPQRPPQPLNWVTIGTSDLEAPDGVLGFSWVLWGLIGGGLVPGTDMFDVNQFEFAEIGFAGYREVEVL